MAKFIFITGGVTSSLGKGITTAGIGRILKDRGIKVSAIKFDPYINVDAGTMNPYQHGEVYVTEDGAETDLDLGHYERFMDINLHRQNNVTTGTIYETVIKKERNGEFLGGTVQVVPHVTDEIKKRILQVSKQDQADIVLVEIGGTVGDIESLPFLEAIRQLKREVGVGNSINIHVTLIPFLKSAQELKTKPTQHSVKELRSIGIQPEVIIARSDRPVPEELKDKISLFCDVPIDAVIDIPDVNCIYEVPLLLERKGLGKIIMNLLHFEDKGADLTLWEEFVNKTNHRNEQMTIALVGKYITIKDAYLSVVESLNHSAINLGIDLKIKYISSDILESPGYEDHLQNVNGILVPGGFGKRGIEGKINAIKYARENKIPFLGLCLGLQLTVIEFARSCCGLENAHSEEFDPNSKYLVIKLVPNQKGLVDTGGTMRLGNFSAYLTPNSLVRKLYGVEFINERHRHRYEVNLDFIPLLEKNGLIASGWNRELNLVEVVELKGHPFFIATQFHPEFTSRPTSPHPLFKGFLMKGLEVKN